MEEKNIFHENPVEVRSFDGMALFSLSTLIQSQYWNECKFRWCCTLQYNIIVEHGLINYIDTKAKCRHLKKLTGKGILR
jgi:hypothetical protein